MGVGVGGVGVVVDGVGGDSVVVDGVGGVGVVVDGVGGDSPLGVSSLPSLPLLETPGSARPEI